MGPATGHAARAVLPHGDELPDGRVLITSGDQLDGAHNPDVEVYSAPTADSTMGSLQLVGTDHPTSFYPRQWVLPTGSVLQVTNLAVTSLDPITWAWTAMPSLPEGRAGGPSGMLLPAGPAGSSSVMIAGGLSGKVARSSTVTFDAANPAAGWTPGHAMPTSRAHMNLVQVPDGSAIGIGGNSYDLYSQGQLQTMSYNPATATWTNLAMQGPRRAYHSTAVLLPDGRILSAGDTGVGGGRSLIDVYSPPYLFRGERPQITAAPAQLDYGMTMSITTAGPATTRLVLMAPAATTHANDLHSRHVELAVTSDGFGTFASTAPTAAVAPPGWYMLFTLTADGVPSMASWVHLGS